MLKSLLVALPITLAIALPTLASNNTHIADATEINSSELWPKPEFPIAKGSENSKALNVVQDFFAAYDLSPEFNTMTTMRFPDNLGSKWRSRHEEALHGRANHQSHQTA